MIERGFSFTSAISAANSTTPSFAAMLTGLNPFENGVRRLHGGTLSPQVRTLPEMLREAGYRTYAEVSGPLMPETGLNRGFDDYSYRSYEQRADQLAEPLLARMRGNLRPPWFLLFHLWDLHSPRWVAPQCRTPGCGRTEYARSLSSIDPQLGRLFSGLPENTVAVLTGDHGEDITNGPLDAFRRKLLGSILHHKLAWSIWKRALPGRHFASILRGRIEGHAFGLYDHLVRVPLTFFGPGIVPPGNSALQVRHVDICPTLLELAGAPVPAGLSGISLAGIMRGEPGAHRDAYMEVGAMRNKIQMAGLRVDNRYKLICGLPGDRSVPELYDLEQDQGERRNLADQRPELLAELLGRVRALQERTVAATAMNEQDEQAVLARLKALGYD